MTIRYDSYGAPITESIHEITSRFWPGSYGDRPEPWQRTYECVCGEDLGMDEEGAGDIDVEGAFASHLESLPESSENEERPGRMRTQLKAARAVRQHCDSRA